MACGGPRLQQQSSGCCGINKVSTDVASHLFLKRIAGFPREPNAKRGDPRKGGPRGLNQRQLFDSALTEAPNRTPDLHRCRSPRCSSAPSRRTYGAAHNDDPGQSHQVGRHQQGRVVRKSPRVFTHTENISRPRVELAKRFNVGASIESSSTNLHTKLVAIAGVPRLHARVRHRVRVRADFQPLPCTPTCLEQRRPRIPPSLSPPRPSSGVDKSTFRLN